MKFRNCLLILLSLLAVVLLMPYAASAQSDENETETETDELEEYMQPDEETLLSWPFSEDIDEGRDTYLSRLDPEGRVWHENGNGETLAFRRAAYPGTWL